jgi:hypothetical protein
MASSTPSSVKSEPTGPLYSGHERNLSYTSMYDTSLENNLPIQKDPKPQASSSIFIDTPNAQSNQTFDHLQGYSAPTLPVYINMGVNEHANDVHFSGQSLTPDPHLSRSLASIDVDHPIRPPAIQRHTSQHHHHHYPHHSQNRNRYPYLQRPISSKVINVAQGSRTSLDGYEQRPAFRRSYFALRRQRIPKGNEIN